TLFRSADFFMFNLLRNNVFSLQSLQFAWRLLHSRRHLTRWVRGQIAPLGAKPTNCGKIVTDVY
ncbi:MAG: hypothetical protein K2X09_06225, partial [Rickettsiales bacterium]|nr:hypothetical protein [Rickettsiales bacterium]